MGVGTFALSFGSMMSIDKLSTIFQRIMLCDGWNKNCLMITKEDF
jgi:hypothetical protein